MNHYEALHLTALLSWQVQNFLVTLSLESQIRGMGFYLKFKFKYSNVWWSATVLVWLIYLSIIYICFYLFIHSFIYYLYMSSNHILIIPCGVFLQLKGFLGRVFLIPSIARSEIDDVIELIRTKCDLHQPEDGTKPEISTTGAGCNFFRERLEKGLNIR